MTTGAFAHDGPTRSPSAGRIGALAAVTPIAMFGAWVLVAGWGGTTFELVRGVAGIGLGAVVAGWIIGAHLGRSIASGLVGLVAYGLFTYLVLLPLNVLGAAWEDLDAGRVSNALEFVVIATGYLLYGLLSGIYAFVYLLPFGAGWIVTFLVFLRAYDR